MRINAQIKPSPIIQSTLNDEGVNISTDKAVYFPGDTLRLAIQLNDVYEAPNVTPTVGIKGTKFKAVGKNAYFAVIPQTVTPGSYPVLLRVRDPQGQSLTYETDCIVEVEEYQAVEQITNYVSIGPEAGGDNPQVLTSLDRDQIRNLHVVFHRDNIRPRMGPQFVTIRTTVLLREGGTAQTFERRVVTFRSRGNAQEDRALFIQFRTAYGPYAAISPEELEKVILQLDSLPGWSTIKVTIEPDYTIKIGAMDRSNSITRYFLVRGPTIEIGFSLGIPKILYDTQAEDSIAYGNTSAMLRFYYVYTETGHRFPVSIGVGTFGVSSPIDVGVGRGGFALSMFLDLVELTRMHDIGFIKKISAGIELTPFFPIQRKGRILINAQVGVSL